MEREELLKLMTYKGEVPIDAIQINDSYIVAIYKGNKSPADILIRYRQKTEKGWSRIRTPKHVHWTVDMLIKLSHDRIKAEQFIVKLQKIWKDLKGLKPETRDSLKLEELLSYDSEVISEFKELSQHGEYNVKFLLLLAKLLMIQEKTNYPDGRMFQQLLAKLKEEKDIFSILQTATFK